MKNEDSGFTSTNYTSINKIILLEEEDENL